MGSEKREAAVAALRRIMDGIASEVVERKVEAAVEIRRLTKTSARNRRHLSDAIGPLVGMLWSNDLVAYEAALRALLNLAVMDDRNKIRMIESGALPRIIDFLQSANLNVQECATATLLTLTASSTNKPIISEAGAIPVLVKILETGKLQAKIDAILALYNLSTLSNTLTTMLAYCPIPALITLLNQCSKSSKTTEKCCAILEFLMEFKEARDGLAEVEDGILTIVEVLEDGLPQGRDHALGVLLKMVETDRKRFKDSILEEGAMPAILELTVDGTENSKSKARKLLNLLRDTPHTRSRLEAEALEDIVSSIVFRIDGNCDDQAEKARKMLAEMVQVSMEQSWRDLQKRAGMICPKTDFSLT